MWIVLMIKINLYVLFVDFPLLRVVYLVVLTEGNGVDESLLEGLNVNMHTSAWP